MDPLPMALGCALDESGLCSQYERYRQAGAGALVVDRTQQRLVVDLDEHVEVQLVDELLAVERACCPFFELAWEPPARRLTVSVSQAAHEPALDGIAFALGLGEGPT
jgi:hypothetical protein